MDRSCNLVCTISLHDALPISTLPYEYGHEYSTRYVRVRLYPSSRDRLACIRHGYTGQRESVQRRGGVREDRKSTRLNSSHVRISYAVFCLKKKIIIAIEYIFV